MTQVMEALERASEKRQQRSDLKKRVRAGEMPVAAVIAVNPEILRTRSSAAKPITVAEILTWQPRWGEARAERFLDRVGISPRLELWMLSPERRKMLAKELV